MADYLVEIVLLLSAVVLVLVFAVFALARQIGVLHTRLAPAGALMTTAGPKVRPGGTRVVGSRYQWQAHHHRWRAEAAAIGAVSSLPVRSARSWCPLPGPWPGVRNSLWCLAAMAVS